VLFQRDALAPVGGHSAQPVPARDYAHAA